MAMQKSMVMRTQRAGSDMALNTVLTNNLALLNLNYVQAGSAALAIATTATKAKTTASVTPVVDGSPRTAVGATDNFWTLDPTCSLAAGQCIPVLLLVDASGTASILAGTAAIGTTPTQAQYPKVPDAKCIIGIVLIAVNTSNTFTGGTTALNGTGVTATFVNGEGNMMFSGIADMSNVLIQDTGV